MYLEAGNYSLPFSSWRNGDWGRRGGVGGHRKHYSKEKDGVKRGKGGEPAGGMGWERKGAGLDW